MLNDPRKTVNPTLRVKYLVHLNLFLLQNMMLVDVLFAKYLNRCSSGLFKVLRGQIVFPFSNFNVTLKLSKGFFKNNPLEGYC